MIQTFQSYHPTVAFIYFVMVVAFTVLVLHPVFLFISFTAAMAYAFYLKGARAMKRIVGFVAGGFFILALVNPMFQHRGMTILFYTSYNPVTLESIIYGICAAVMLLAVVVWFLCYNEIMTSDKFLYLFGRLSPAVSLIISMTLRLIPRLRRQLGIIYSAQRSAGRGDPGGGVFGRIRYGLKILSALISWALENAIETADSMKARGYGLKGRTSFSLFCFTARDGVVLGVIFLCAGLNFGFMAGKVADFTFYPYIKWAPVTPAFVAAVALHTALCFLPLILDIAELIKWKCFE